MVVIGVRVKEFKVRRRKLTPSQIEFVRDPLNKELTNKDLAEMFGVSSSTIQKVRTFEMYKPVLCQNCNKEIL